MFSHVIESTITDTQDIGISTSYLVKCIYIVCSCVISYHDSFLIAPL